MLAGQWVKFGDVDFGIGLSGFSAQVAKTDTTPASIQVRLDDPVNGPVIATVPVTTPVASTTGPR